MKALLISLSLILVMSDSSAITIRKEFMKGLNLRAEVEQQVSKPDTILINVDTLLGLRANNSTLVNLYSNWTATF